MCEITRFKNAIFVNGLMDSFMFMNHKSWYQISTHNKGKLSLCPLSTIFGGLAILYPFLGHERTSGARPTNADNKQADQERKNNNKAIL